MNENKNLVFIQGESEEISNALELDGLLAHVKPEFTLDFSNVESAQSIDNTNILVVGIYTLESNLRDRSVLTNTDLLCLVGIDGKNADELLDEYGGYVFRFLDQVSCTSFLKGFCYIQNTMDCPDYYLHDANITLGHKQGSSKQICSIDIYNYTNLDKINGMIAFAFTKENGIKELYSAEISKIASEIAVLVQFYESELNYHACLVLQ